jgi:hypothetical protein
MLPLGAPIARLLMPPPEESPCGAPTPSAAELSSPAAGGHIERTCTPSRSVRRGVGVNLQSDRTRLRRKPDRCSHERREVEAILDEAVHCHVGFAIDDQPYVIPTIPARVGELLYLPGGMVRAHDA